MLLIIIFIINVANHYFYYRCKILFCYFLFRNEEDEEDPSKPLVYKDKKEAIEAFKDLLKEKVFPKLLKME